MTYRPVVAPPAPMGPMMIYTDQNPVAAGGGVYSGPFLLDTYSGAIAAYSIARQLKATARAAIRVRRASDNRGLFIGFSPATGGLDTAPLLAFVGGSDGQVDTLLDQAGDAGLQNGTMGDRPLIVSGGSLNVLGARPAMLFNATDYLNALADRPSFSTNNGLSGNAAYSVFIVHKKTVATAGSLYGWGSVFTTLGSTGFLDDNTAASCGIQFAGGNGFKTTVPANNTHYLTTVIKTAGAINTTTAVYRNGVSVASTGHSTSTPNVVEASSLYLGRWANYASNGLQGYIQEFIIFAGDKSADRAAIEANINAYYGIY